MNHEPVHRPPQPDPRQPLIPVVPLDGSQAPQAEAGPRVSPAVRAKLREAVDELVAGFDAVYDLTYERPDGHTFDEMWAAIKRHGKAEDRLRALMVEAGVGAVIIDGELYVDVEQDDGCHVETKNVVGMDASLLVNLDVE